MNKWAKQPGFTIVELLVVIVVIGILAAITVVAYNGFRGRADMSARLAETDAWKKLINRYISETDKLPMTGSTVYDTNTNDSTYCLGTGFPDTDWRSGGYNTGSCRTLYPCGGDITCANEYKRGHVDASLNTELAKYGTLPTGPRSLPAGEGSLGPFVKFYAADKMGLANYYPAAECPIYSTQFDAWPPTNPKVVGCEIVIQK